MKIIGYVSQCGKAIYCRVHTGLYAVLPFYGTTVGRQCSLCHCVVKANRKPGRENYKDLTRNQS